MKRITLSLLFLLSIVGSMMAQKYTCHIEGTTTDSEAKELYLIESGADVRAQANVISIPVVDGKFGYDLKKDAILYFLKSEIKDMDNEQRRAYVEEFYSENRHESTFFCVQAVGQGIGRSFHEDENGNRNVA